MVPSEFAPKAPLERAMSRLAWDAMLLVGGTKYSSRGTPERFPSSPSWQTIFDPDGSLVRKRHCNCGIEHEFATQHSGLSCSHEAYL
jgi:hypothetical protein